MKEILPKIVITKTDTETRIRHIFFPLTSQYSQIQTKNYMMTDGYAYIEKYTIY